MFLVLIFESPASESLPWTDSKLCWDRTMRLLSEILKIIAPLQWLSACVAGIVAQIVGILSDPGPFRQDWFTGQPSFADAGMHPTMPGCTNLFGCALSVGSQGLFVILFVVCVVPSWRQLAWKILKGSLATSGHPWRIWKCSNNCSCCNLGFNLWSWEVLYFIVPCVCTLVDNLLYCNQI